MLLCAVGSVRDFERFFLTLLTLLATAAKFTIEQYYDNLEKMRSERIERFVTAFSDILTSVAVTCRVFFRRSRRQLEGVIVGLPESEKEQRRAELARHETDYTRLRRVKLRESSFELLKRIGRGAFGEVWLVQLKGEIVVKNTQHSRL